MKKKHGIKIYKSVGSYSAMCYICGWCCLSVQEKDLRRAITRHKGKDGVDRCIAL